MSRRRERDRPSTPPFAVPKGPRPPIVGRSDPFGTTAHDFPMRRCLLPSFANAHPLPGSLLRKEAITGWVTCVSTMTQQCHTDQLVWFKRERVVLKGEKLSLKAEGVGTLRVTSGRFWREKGTCLGLQGRSHATKVPGYIRNSAIHGLIFTSYPCGRSNLVGMVTQTMTRSTVDLRRVVVRRASH
jgi:hypothetical protein